MPNYVTPQNIFDLFVLLGGIAFIFAQVNLGRSQKKSNDDSDYLVTLKLKDQKISALDEELKRVNAILIQDGKDIAVLQAENLRLSALNANRSPELENLMKQVIEALNEQTKAINALLSKPASATVINNTQTPTGQ